MNKMKKDDSGGAGLGPGFLGPKYKYQDFIKNTDEMGMSGAPTFAALGKDIAGVISYSQLILEGGGKARKGGPLGNRFFVKTGTKCQPSKKVGGEWKAIPGEGKAARYLWIDNTTKGKLPFISGKSPFKGLVPGMMENMGALNPMSLMAGMVEGSTPPCTKIRRRTGPFKGGSMKTESHYVAVKDQEGFETMKQFLNQKPSKKTYKLNLKDNLFASCYNAGFGILVIYLLFHFMKK